MALKLAKAKLIMQAIQKSKYQKTTRWIMWLVGKLRKKGYLADPNICAYGNTQIVGRVIRYGGAYVFWSKACGGCHFGENLIKDYEKTKQLPQELPCALLKNAFISLKPVSEGEVKVLLPLLNR